MPKALKRLQSKIISDFCSKHNLTLYRLAQIMGVNLSTLQHWEKGRTAPPNWVGKMFELLEVTGFHVGTPKYSEQDIKKMLYAQLSTLTWHTIIELRLIDCYPYSLGVLIWVDDCGSISFVDIRNISEILDLKNTYILAWLPSIDIWAALADEVEIDKKGRYISRYIPNKSRRKRMRERHELIDYYFDTKDWKSEIDVMRADIITQYQNKQI